MIYKLCAVCQRYFVGELNGSYICPQCRDHQQAAVAAPAPEVMAASPAPHPPAPSRAA